MAKIAIIGAGAWGSALACVAARGGHDAMIWARSSDVADEINTSNTNQIYLDDLKLEPAISATTDLQSALSSADVALLCVPTQSLAVILEEIKPHMTDQALISTCKGIDQSSGKLPHELVESAFANNRVASLSGPSFATDVVRKLPTAVTIACENEAHGYNLAKLLSTETFRCYASSDLKGVELGGAMKNVLALAVGAARGMRLGASAEAALIARGFAEISKLVVSQGGKPETLMGLSGLGDITLTCSSPQSRNFTYGMAMGEGSSLEGLKLAEGAFTAAIALQIAQKSGIETPITEAIVNVLEKRVTAREAVEQLLTRPLKREN